MGPKTETTYTDAVGDILCHQFDPELAHSWVKVRLVVCLDA